MSRQLHEPIPPISEIRSEVPVAVDSVLQRATDKDPSGRYQDISEFVDAFKHAVGLVDIRETMPVATTEPIVRGRQLTMVGTGMDNPYKGLRAFDEGDAGDSSAATGSWTSWWVA